MRTKKIVIVYLLFLFACTSATINNILAKVPKKAWTALVYLDADNDLDDLAHIDLNELISVGSTDQVDVLVLVDRRYEPAYLYMVCKGSLKELTNFELNGKEVNMGNPETLRSFVKYGFKCFPAERTVLFFWDHGGPLTGVAMDEHPDTTGAGAPDWLSHQEIIQALKDFKIDVLATDECLIGQIEVAYEYLVNGLQIDYLIGDEGYMGYRGFPYDAILSHLVANPQMSSRDLALVIIEEFSILFSKPPYMSEVVTATSAIELDKVDDVVSGLRTLTGMLSADIKSYFNVITAARARAMLTWGEYGHEAIVDLTTFVKGVAESGEVSQEIKGACKSVLESLSEAVLGVGTTMVTERMPFEGMGIFFPSSYDAFEHHLTTAFDCYENFAFAQAAGWLNFLNAYWRLSRS
jgi:hypothetical protein